MRKIRMLLFLGIWVAILPYLGFPYTWKDFLGALTGLVLIGFSYMLYKETQTKGRAESYENFSENSEFRENV